MINFVLQVGLLETIQRVVRTPAHPPRIPLPVVRSCFKTQAASRRC